jgi:hypothetical protein
MEDGPRRQEELVEVVGRSWGMVGPWLELVRVPPSGTWDARRANLFQTAERWLGPEDVGMDDALDHLVRRYLGGFGPAAASDIARWAGVKPRDVAPALERLSLRRFHDETGGDLLDLPRAPLPHPETPAPVRFLPTWDAVLLVHARRTGVLPETYRSRIFPTTMPQSVGTFLVDGVVAGTWRYDGRVTWEAFGRLDRASTREVAAEAERLAAFCAKRRQCCAERARRTRDEHRQNEVGGRRRPGRVENARASWRDEMVDALVARA